MFDVKFQSIFDSVSEEEKAFDTIFGADEDDKLMECVLLGEEAQEEDLHNEDEEVTPKDFQDDMGPNHDTENKPETKQDEFNLEDDALKLASGESDADKFHDDADKEHQEGKDNGCTCKVDPENIDKSFDEAFSKIMEEADEDCKNCTEEQLDAVKVSGSVEDLEDHPEDDDEPKSLVDDLDDHEEQPEEGAKSEGEEAPTPEDDLDKQIEEAFKFFNEDDEPDSLVDGLENPESDNNDDEDDLDKQLEEAYNRLLESDLDDDDEEDIFIKDVENTDDNVDIKKLDNDEDEDLIDLVLNEK